MWHRAPPPSTLYQVVSSEIKVLVVLGVQVVCLLWFALVKLIGVEKCEFTYFGIYLHCWVVLW